jgi:hypothetical protein
MSVQKYVITKESSNYTTISNKIIRALKDDLKLLGFYLYLLSLPPCWVFYKSELKSTCNIGVKKLEKFLKILAQYNLVEVAQLRNEKGNFAQMNLTVLNGESFKIKDLQNPAQPCVNTRTAVNGSTVKNTYKRKIDKEHIKENKDKNICATENIAQNRFDEFWVLYPRKKDKKRAKAIWDKTKLDIKADQIIKDVKERILNDRAWINPEYIPHPSTYLKFERWSDEITLTTIPTSNKNSVDKALDYAGERRQRRLQRENQGSPQ